MFLVKAFYYRNRSCASEHDQHDDIYEFCGSFGGPCRCKSEDLDGDEYYSSDSETDESETTSKKLGWRRGGRGQNWKCLCTP
jgi:hypothetical protein